MNDFEAQWDRCADWLQAALNAGQELLTLDDVKQRVCSGQYQFWPAQDSAAITQVIDGHELNIPLAGGKMETLRDAISVIEEFGVRMGCSKMTVVGRLGWARSFLTKEAGFEPVAMVFCKRIGGAA